MTIYKRSKEINLLISKIGNRKIKVITGLRQCGKTYLLDNLFYKRLKELNITNEETFKKIYLFSTHKQYCGEKDFEKLLSSIATQKPKIIFIDEVQEAENYQKTLIRFLNNHPDIDLYVTGSNSHTLSVDIIENFKEYGDQICVYPLSYSEIKKYKKTYSVNDYLKYGGIPIVLNSENKEEQLKSLYKTVYQIDILDRCKKMNFRYLSEKDFEYIISNILSSTTQFSVTEQTNVPNQIKIEIRKEINDFLSIVEKSFLMRTIDNLDCDGKVPLERIGLGKKYYCVDCGLAYQKCDAADKKYSISLEHAICSHLFVLGYKPKCLIFLDSNNKMNGEIDFTYENNFVQVVYRLTNDNQQREVGNLLKLGDHCKKTVVFVVNELEISVNDVTLVNAEDYLLGK